MYDGQLEMSFNNGRGCQTTSRRQRRLSRAQWWFQRMREVVDRATDWRPAPSPRPEQIWFAGAHREAEAAPRRVDAPRPEQQQVCE
jgi:hypothetical protein